MYKLSGSKHIDLSKIIKKGKNIYDDIPAVKRKRRALKILKILKFTSYTVISICLLLVIFFAVHVANIRLVHTGLANGQNKLINASRLLKDKKFNKSISEAKFAENYFNDSANIVEEYKNNYIIKKSNFFSAQLNDFLYLLGAGQLLSRGVQISADYSRATDPTRWRKENFYTLEIEQKKKVLNEVYSREPELNGVKASVALARLKLENIKFTGILGFQPIKKSIINLSLELKETESFLNNVIPLAGIIPNLLGFPNESSNLIVFEDSRELWPTGGKIRAVGVLSLNNGEIVSLDSYSLDEFDVSGVRGPRVAQTSPLNMYLGRSYWGLSEANWLPDWPTTAKRVVYFINRSPICNNKNITGSIGINTKAISEIFELSGPVIVDNIEYDKHNFISFFNEGGNTQLLGKLAKELVNTLLSKSLTETNVAIEVITKNLSEKNIILNFKDTETQKLIKKSGWSGEFTKVSGDFLAVVDSNFGNNKIDSFVNRRVDYKVDETINGYFSELNLNYANRNSEEDYKNYFRIYVPLGSILIDSGPEVGSTIETYNEFAKTVFSGFVRVPPNSIKNIKLKYKLPVNTSNNFAENYELYIQKQAGNTTGQLIVDLSLQNKVKSYIPTGFNVFRKNDKNVRWEVELDSDKQFYIYY